MSEWQDSNLRSPAPKAGGLTYCPTFRDRSPRRDGGFGDRGTVRRSLPSGRRCRQWRGSPSPPKVPRPGHPCRTVKDGLTLPGAGSGNDAHAPGPGPAGQPPRSTPPAHQACQGYERSGRQGSRRGSCRGACANRRTDAATDSARPLQTDTGYDADLLKQAVCAGQTVGEPRVRVPLPTHRDRTLCANGSGRWRTTS